ncbi:hypothetical protein MUN78_06965 [Leucobacter allii]|uniref:Uncharacterized protein n=1 Tax=Leucobacter allii TaxID=2932247 RepID=A0ABY4FQM1_9MICO|nr:hypothetical protein [Leucobacter allii]UOQ58557.1 hypothetical protein MUN78_06965 [Leucobacter allii]
MKFYTPVLNEVEAAARDGLREGLGAMLERSNELAPKDDLDLVKSGAVRIDDLTGQVSYSALHAAWQHENLEWEHEDGGQAKFLEAAAEQVDVAAFVAARTRERLGG